MDKILNLVSPDFIINPTIVSKSLNITEEEAVLKLLDLLSKDRIKIIYRDMSKEVWEDSLKKLRHLKIDEIEIGFIGNTYDKLIS